jgi:sugar/nucleoside kinase (ribokinase family)
MSKILVAGELNPDFILQGSRFFPVPGKETIAEDFTMTLGSASAICAMGLARLGNQVSFITQVGKDLWGDFCIEALQSGGVDVSLIVRDANLKTGITVSITCPNERALVTYPGSSTALRESDIDDSMLRDSEHLHVSSYYLQRGLRPGCRRLFARSRSLGLTTSLDPGYDPSELWGSDLQETLLETDLFLPNESEAAALTGCEDPRDSLAAIHNGRTLTVLKLGTQGCVTIENSDILHQGAFPVKCIDTTGAGDSFNAGFLDAWLRHLNLSECLLRAAAGGALSTLALGGTAGQPDEVQLTSFLKTL